MQYKRETDVVPVEWTGRDVTCSPQRFIHDWVAEVAMYAPDAPAVVSAEGLLTYAELEEEANRLALRIRRAGVLPRSSVGILMQRSSHMVVSMLAVWKAGAAFVPIDPKYPQERIAFLLEDSEVSLVLTQRSMAELVPDGVATFCVDGKAEEQAAESEWEPELFDEEELSFADVAYVIYTSGSTGLPKGVEVMHGNLFNLVSFIHRTFELTVEDRFSQLAGAGFDATMIEIWPALTLGACLFIADEEARVSPERLQAFLLKHEITFTFAPTPMAEALLTLTWPEETPLRWLNAGGDKLRRYPRTGTPFTLVNTYGPTECAVVSTVAVIEPYSGDALPPIGRPFDNVRVYVLDEQMKQVPAGVEGELYVGGLGVGRGYRNRPELTAERFLADPFADQPGSRMYKTGDLVKFRSDGLLEFIGRIDMQVKIRGVRVELGEIEAVLCRHEAVREAVVVVKESQFADGTFDQALIAYVAPVAQEQIDEAELLAFVRQKLPGAMVPRTVMVLERLPVTPNGKVDRRALPEPVLSGTQEANGGDPATSAEEMLAGVWSRLLGVAGIGREDSFFQLGGHSLLAYRLVSAIRERFAVELTLNQVFETPTLVEMARLVEQVGEAGPIPPVVPRATEGDQPLSSAQQRLWFLHQMDPELPLYNLPMAYRVRGALDLDVLEHSLQEMVKRHESLRTVFPQVGREPVQRVLQEMGVAPEVTDLTHLPEPGRQAGALLRMQEEGKRPFDLEKGPLFRVYVYRVGEQEFDVLFSFHHIVTDGWSQLVFMREWLGLYAASAEGLPSSLPDLDVQYVDYTLWQQEVLTEELLERQVAYWQGQLAGAPELMELPTDFPRPPVQTHRGAKHQFVLPKELAEALGKLSREQGVTLFMTLLSAWAVLLHRYSGQEEVVIGAPVAGRSRQEIEGVIGFFVNTLPMRVDFAGELTVLELLQQVRDVALGAFAHQEVPFEKLVEALQPERDRSYAPLFQVMFALQSDQSHALQAPHLQVEELAVETQTAKFDLTLEFTDTARGLVGSLEYSTDLFTRETAERMQASLTALLQGMVADPTQRVAHLPILTSEQREQVLMVWNETASEYLGGCVSLAELFEEQVARGADRIALVQGERQVTYGELNELANRLARVLRQEGVQGKQLVGLCMERSVEMIVAVLAIVKTGAAYVPLDPAYPEERLAFMLEDAEVAVLVAQSHLVERLPIREEKVICLDGIPEWLLSEKGDNLPREEALENTLYVMYTSGSTGRPKGVCVTQRGVARLVKATNYAAFASEDVFLQFAPISFDASTFEIWASLLNGARLVLAPAGKLSLEELGEVIVQQGIDTVFLTAAVFHQMVETHLHLLRNVRRVFTGGDVISPTHVRRVFQELDGCVVFNCYGPTENASFTTCYPIREASQVGASVSIGRPISNTQVYVLDRHLQPVPVGVAGELFTGGDGLANGYLRRPEMTAEKFIPHPFAVSETQAVALLYRTGDWVKYRADGTLEFLGRVDNQVKLRGFRIELGEIEAAIRAHEAVREVLVLAREDVPGDKRLVAYVVPEPERDVEAQELRSFLAATLPDYMNPSAFVMLERMPVTINGKVDRRALPAPQMSALAERAYAPLQTPTEELLAGLWSQLLRVEQIGREDDFFSLGGHSLLATQLVSAIRETFEVEMKLSRLFDARTLAGIAAAIDEMGRGLQAPSIATGLCVGDQPLSFAQRRLWFLDQMEPESALYNVPVVYGLQGALDVAAMQRSVQMLVDRHAALRTVFPIHEQQPVQRVLAEMHVPFAVIDATGSAGQDVQHLLKNEAQRPFDLVNGPLVRVTLLVCGAEEHVLVLNLHHIVTDGWSMEIVMRELLALYEAERAGQAVSLPALPVEYVDYSRWQQEWLQGDVLAQQVTYWQQQLVHAPKVLELPTDRPRPPVMAYRGDSQPFALSKAATERLHALSRQEGVTLFMTLLAAWSALLHRYSGQEEIVVGSPIAGRNRQEVEGVVGFFVNTLALRVQAAGVRNFRELLRQVREVAVGAYMHQDLPFEKLIDALHLERDLSYSPVFQVMFVLQPEIAPHELPGLTFEPQYVDVGVAKFDLSLEVMDTANGLKGNLVYNTDLFDAATVERMAMHLRLLLEEVPYTLELAVAKLPLLTEPERKQLLVEWNDTAVSFDGVQVLHHLIEEQVERTPDHVAVAYEGESLTYRELNKRANRLAHHLRQLGAGPNVMIGLAVERSLEMSVGLLGILKSGSAYVPLDPTYPKDRLAFMLADADVPVLLTTEAMLEMLPAHQAQVVCLDRDWAQIAENSAENLPLLASPDDLAYMIYTSGSTGQPKGAMNSHRAICNSLLFMQSQYRLTAEDVVLQKTPFSFDVSLWELFWPLLAGAQIEMARPEGHKDAPYLVDVVQRAGVTTLVFVPSMLQVFLEEPRSGQCASVRRVLCAGEALPLDLQERFFTQFSAELHNLYGPTEAAIIVTAWACERESKRRSVPIGRAVANTQLYVLDQELQPVPIGVAGELHIGGVQVGQGYRNRPELTAERFIPDPFANEPVARLYKTGDLACFRADGTIEYLGRIDNQVKLRGLRIELGEIESRLAEYPAVREAVVLAKECGPHDVRLVAYCTAAQEKELEIGELKAFLGTVLPDYMVPQLLVQIAEMPLSPSGKADRRALAQLPVELPEASAAYVAPRTETEARLCRLLGELLRIEQVGVLDNFFDIGANSLLLARLGIQLRESWQLDCSVRELFEAPTVAELAEVVEGKLLQKADSAVTSASQDLWDDVWEEELPPLDASEAERLIEGLSDEEVEALLGQLYQEEGSESDE